MTNQIFHTSNLAETQKVASNFAKLFKDKGGIILFTGKLGAGKTTFTQGFIKSFGIKDKVISPTFLLQRQYQIPNTNRHIFHLDLYRLAGPINLSETGIDELLTTANENIIVIEWSEKLTDDQIKKPIYKISLKKDNVDENKRIIKIEKIIP